MSARTRDILLFLVVLVVCAGLLFAVWAPTMTGYAVFLGGAGSVTRSSATSAAMAGSANLLYLVPAIALIVAARGAAWRRKLVWLAILLGPLLGIHLFLALTGVTAAFATTAGGTAAGAVAATLIYHTLPIVWPIAVVFMFVGGRPAMLWDSACGDTPAASDDAEQ
jgi:hypothetical protein